jgi:plastocyanin
MREVSLVFGAVGLGKRRETARLGEGMKKLVLLTALVAGAAFTPQAFATTFQVSITHAGFVPNNLQVRVGDTVVWTNADTRDRQVASKPAGFTSPVLHPGNTFPFTYMKVGKFDYQDALVKGQKGTVRVAAAAAVGDISIAAKPGIVTYGRATTLSGVVSSHQAGEKVTVFGRTCGQTFTRITDVTTTTGGAWTFTVKPLNHTAYRAQWKSFTSADVTVRVRPRLTLARLAPHRFRARVFAAQSFAGKAVAFQRWNATRKVWVRVRWVTLVDTGTGIDPTVISGRSFRSKIATGRRVRLTMGPVVAGSCYLPNRSNVIFS